MSKEMTKTPIALAIGAIFGVALGTTPLVNAGENPFGMQDLSSGYMLLAEAEEGDKGKEGKCGGDKGEEGDKGKEGKCGGDKGEEGDKGKEGSEEGDKGKEGKCGEGKCGGDKKCGDDKECGDDAGKEGEDSEESDTKKEDEKTF